MKTMKWHEQSGTFCPWNNKYGQCVGCMAMIEIDDDRFICGRLYPPEHFKKELNDGHERLTELEETDR